MANRFFNAGRKAASKLYPETVRAIGSAAVILGSNVLVGKHGKSDNNFYGHIKAGSHKASRKLKGACS